AKRIVSVADSSILYGHFVNYYRDLADTNTLKKFGFDLPVAKLSHVQIKQS
ncbi:hypothetical protein Ciccas_012731, partial [Cichlidogyrus casuarinus]